MSESNAYQAPESEVDGAGKELAVVYGGFWVRVMASIIDSILMAIIIYPILMSIYGKDYFSSTHLVNGSLDALFSYVLPAVVVVLFWVYRSATPGKMAFGLKIVHAETLGKPTSGQLILRYLGYYVCIIPLFLGLFWVAFDKRKQGWHDKMANTVVVKG